MRYTETAKRSWPACFSRFHSYSVAVTIGTRQLHETSILYCVHKIIPIIEMQTVLYEAPSNFRTRYEQCILREREWGPWCALVSRSDAVWTMGFRSSGTSRVNVKPAPTASAMGDSRFSWSLNASRARRYCAPTLDLLKCRWVAVHMVGTRQSTTIRVDETQRESPETRIIRISLKLQIDCLQKKKKRIRYKSSIQSRKTWK